MCGRSWRQCHQDHIAEALALLQPFLVVEEQRMFERFITENLLTATNTFHFEDDGATDIYTCNYNGKHEPINRLTTSFHPSHMKRTIAKQKYATTNTTCHTCHSVTDTHAPNNKYRKASKPSRYQQICPLHFETHFVPRKEAG